MEEEAHAPPSLSPSSHHKLTESNIHHQELEARPWVSAQGVLEYLSM